MNKNKEGCIYMEPKKDFYENDLENVFSYWYDQENLRRNTIKKTAEVFSMMYHNIEGRINREKSLKDMGYELIDGRSNYKSLVVFEKDTKPLFDEFDKMENGSKLKTALTNFKKALALTSFKKIGNKDIENMEQGKVGKQEMNTIVDSVIMIKDNIKNDKNASVILDNMMKQPSFKKEFDSASQRADDIKKLKDNISDNHFVEWIKDMGSYYGVKSIEHSIEKNDKDAIQYRKEIMPELEGFSALMDRLNLSDDKNNTSYSLKFTDIELKGIEKLKAVIDEYKVNKIEFDNLKNNGLDLSKPISIDDLPIIKNKSVNNAPSIAIDDIPLVKTKSDSHYRESLNQVEFNFNIIENSKDSSYSIRERVRDMAYIKREIERLPSQVDNPNDEIKIAYYKKSMMNSDIAMLVDMEGLKGSFEQLKNNGAFQHLKNNFKDVPETSKTPYSPSMKEYENSLEKITEWVDRVEAKHGKSGIPLFDEAEKSAFNNYKQIASSYKQYKEDQSLKSNNMLTV